MVLWLEFAPLAFGSVKDLYHKAVVYNSAWLGRQSAIPQVLQYLHSNENISAKHYHNEVTARMRAYVCAWVRACVCVCCVIKILQLQKTPTARVLIYLISAAVMVILVILVYRGKQ